MMRARGEWRFRRVTNTKKKWVFFPLFPKTLLQSPPPLPGGWQAARGGWREAARQGELAEGSGRGGAGGAGRRRGEGARESAQQGMEIRWDVPEVAPTGIVARVSSRINGSRQVASLASYAIQYGYILYASEVSKVVSSKPFIA